MKSRLVALMLPLSLAACQIGDGYDSYYTGTPPEVSGLSETGELGNIGGQVTVINGSGFGTDPNQLTVVFGAANAEILEVSDGAITVVVPRGPQEGGATDVRVGTPGGAITYTGGYLYDMSTGDGVDFYADQIAYITLDNDYYSCYGGIGANVPGVEFCDDFAFSGLTGVAGRAEFLEMTFPRVHTPYVGERNGFGGGGDWSWGTWAFEAPTQDFITVDIENVYQDKRVDVGPMRIRNPSIQGDSWYTDMSILGQYVYPGGEGEDGEILDPYVVTISDEVSLIEEGDRGEPWVQKYDRGIVNYCMVQEYETPTSYLYETDFPVGSYLFESEVDEVTGEVAPVELEVDVPRLDLNGQPLTFPPAAIFYNTAGTALAGDPDISNLWGITSTSTTCPDSNGDKATTLDDAAFSWEWEPFQGELETDGRIVSSRTFVRASVNVFSLGWYGGEGAPLRATISVPDDNNYDPETGMSSLEIPVGFFYQFPSMQFDVGETGAGGLSTFTWGDPAQSEYYFLITVLERVTEYSVAVSYEGQDGVTRTGNVVIASSSGDIGYTTWDNPLDGGPCSNCQDEDGDGWTDGADPDCGGADSTEDDSQYGIFTCNDGLDNDGDGDIDAEDDNCTTGEDTESNCNDGIDNDEDGWIDEEDGECVTSGFELGEDDPDWGCGNGLDDDADGWFDMEDPDCDSTADEELGFIAEYQCNNGIDDDGHGDIDTLDPLCLFRGPLALEQPLGFTAQCSNGNDDDDDGYIDENDPHCEVSPFDSEGRDEWSTATYDPIPACYNQDDDDSDGFVDALDPGCVGKSGLPDGFGRDETDPLP